MLDVIDDGPKNEPIFGKSVLRAYTFMSYQWRDECGLILNQSNCNLGVTGRYYQQVDD